MPKRDKLSFPASISPYSTSQVLLKKKKIETRKTPKLKKYKHLKTQSSSVQGSLPLKL